MKDKKYNIKAFLFDLGNVILPFDHRLAAIRIKQYTDKSEQEIYNIFFDSCLGGEFEDGKIKPIDFFCKLKKVLCLDGNLTYKIFKPIWNDIFKEDTRISDLIRSLKKRYKVAIVSNINKMHYEYIKDNFGIINQVNKVILSYKVGVRKPDPKIYKYAFGQVKADPKDIIYIDDRLDLINEASGLGLNCLLYEGYDELIRSLDRFKIIYK